jgi:hypothetical protein
VRSAPRVIPRKKARLGVPGTRCDRGTLTRARHAVPVSPPRSWHGYHGTTRQGRAIRGCDDQISWPTAVRTVPDLACVIAEGYSVNPRIDSKKTV